jgi:imidazolonepropionase-like amidohydrolase
MRTAFVVALVLALVACKPAEDQGHAIAIAGAVLIDGTGGPPLSDSLVVISGGRIQAAGRRTELSIPAGAGVLDGGGRYIVPLPIDVTAGGTSLPRVSTVAEAKPVVAGGASALIGMVGDTAEMDPLFLAELRDLKVVVAPALVSAGPALDLAKRNALRLFQAGVPIAVAGNGDPLRECELLSNAGIPPLDVIVAATANGAKALGQAAERGTIQQGKRADLLLLRANPGEDVRNLRNVERRMESGEWR